MAPNGQKPLLKYLICLLLAGITLAAFAGVANAGFIVLDDGNYVVNHPAIQHGFSWNSVKWAFSSFDSSNWHPLTWLSLMLDYQSFGLNAGGYHLINLTFHVANTVLLFLLLEHLTARLWPSAFVALLFGIHPMHVESVAWVSERKDVLCAFFFLLTLMTYVQFVAAGRLRLTEVNKRQKDDPRSAAVPSPLPSDGRGEGQGEVRARAKGNPPQPSILNPDSPRWLLYALTLFLFALGLMSKPMLVTLPFVLLLLDFWPLQRFTLVPKIAIAAPKQREGSSTLLSRRSWSKADQRLLAEKIPFFILSAVSCFVTYLAQKNGGAIREATEFPVLLRINHLSISYGWYILKLFWPVHLSIYNQLWTRIFLFDVIFATLALVVLTMIALRTARKYPYILFGWLWFLGMMVPVIGVVQVGSQAYADRYSYLPYIGLFIIVAWGVPDLSAKTFKLSSSSFSSSNSAMNIDNPHSCRAETRRRVPIPHLAMGAVTALIAIACFIGTIQEVSYWKDGVTLFGRAAALDPKNESALTLLGEEYCYRGENAKAIDYLNRALTLSQNFYLPWQYMGITYAREGDYARATQAYQNALKYAHFSGTRTDIYNDLGQVFRLGTNDSEAISAYESSLAISSAQPTVQASLGQCLLDSKQPEQAAAAFQAAIDMDPRNAEAQLGLGMCLASAGRDAEALGHFRAAVRADTNSAMALNNLAWTLTADADPSLRNGREAVPLAERACQLTHYQDAQSIGTLAAAYAEAGRFDDAIASARKAHDVALAHGEKDIADRNLQLLKLYEAHKPFHMGDGR